MRLVLDTNSLISAILWRGTPASVFAVVRAGRATAFISAEVLQELTGVLDRSKFRRRLVETNLSVVDVVRHITAVARHVAAPPLPPVPELRDPKDVIILACAVAADADMIVTGDRDLLALRSFRRIPILTAVQALERLSKK